MASFKSLQVQVTCKWCVSKIKWKCCDCYYFMCDKCKETIHPTIQNGKDHKIINLKEVGQDSQERDFKDNKSNRHERQNMPNLFRGNVAKQNYFSLTNFTNKIEMKLVSHFKIDIAGLHQLSMQANDSLWLVCRTRPSVLKYVELNGSSMKVISTLEIYIYGMSLSPSNKLIVASQGSRLKQINNGTLANSLYNIYPLYPISVYASKDGKVIVGAWSHGPAFPVTGRRVVLILDKEGYKQKVFEFDQNEKPIFSNPVYISSTRNGNVWIVDRLSKDMISRVVVLSRTGEILYIYRGIPCISGEEQEFKASCLATTPGDNVIVSDNFSNILHILNNTGCLLKTINTMDIGIRFPISLCFNRSGHVYIGCNNTVGHNGVGQLYEVKISNC